MQSQRGEVVDRALVGELQADVGRLDTGHGSLPIQLVLLMLVLIHIVERAALGQVGTSVIAGEKVVLQAEAPLGAGAEVDRETQGAIRIGDAGPVAERPYNATEDDIRALVAGLQLLGRVPHGLELGPPLPLPPAALEEGG